MLNSSWHWILSLTKECPPKFDYDSKKNQRTKKKPLNICQKHKISLTNNKRRVIKKSNRKTNDFFYWYYLLNAENCVFESRFWKTESNTDKHGSFKLFSTFNNHFKLPGLKRYFLFISFLRRKTGTSLAFL